MKFELNFVVWNQHFTVNKLIAWEKSESGEDSEALAEDQVHSVTEDKSPMADLHRYLASRKAVFWRSQPQRLCTNSIITSLDKQAKDQLN